MTIFFAVNQHLLEGSPHALYCFRHCWWLAKAKPELKIQLLYPGFRAPGDIYRYFGYKSLPNFQVKGLPALRKARDRAGVTINAVYYWALWWYLRKSLEEGDWLISASFAKLFRFLQRRLTSRTSVRWAYEVHQLAVLECGPNSAQTRLEMEVLGHVDCLFTTTEPLRKTLEEHFPDKPIHNLGLGCGFSPEDFPPPLWVRSSLIPARRLTVAYIGSAYPEQGVEWLVQSWPQIQKDQPLPLYLKVAGAQKSEAERLRRLAGGVGANAVSIHGVVPPAELSRFLSDVDATIIPALAAGRMPYVAITKAYDYPGLGRPVLASSLPSIAGVLRDGKEALLFSPGSAGDCAKALHRLATEPGLAKSLVDAAQALAKELSWLKRAENYVNLLYKTSGALSHAIRRDAEANHGL